MIGDAEVHLQQSIDYLQLQGPETYDIVMANWVFDHAANMTELEGMWRNIAAFTKPGGRFIGVRTGEYLPYSEAAADGKYGLLCQDWKKIP